MMRDGYRDWKSSTMTGLQYILDSGSRIKGRASRAGWLPTCSEREQRSGGGGAQWQ